MLRAPARLAGRRHTGYIQADYRRITGGLQADYRRVRGGLEAVTWILCRECGGGGSQSMGFMTRHAPAATLQEAVMRAYSQCRMRGDRILPHGGHDLISQSVSWGALACEELTGGSDMSGEVVQSGSRPGGALVRGVS